MDTINVHRENGNALPPPPALEINDLPTTEKCKNFQQAGGYYSLAMELNEKLEAIQVTILLTVIGEEACEVFSTFAWTRADDSAKINPALKNFEEYCQLCENAPFERYRFNSQVQELGETYDQYRTTLLKIAKGCEFQTITPNEILRDRFVFGIRDNKVKERLL